MSVKGALQLLIHCYGRIRVAHVDERVNPSALQPGLGSAGHH